MWVDFASLTRPNLEHIRSKAPDFIKAFPGSKRYPASCISLMSCIYDGTASSFWQPVKMNGEPDSHAQKVVSPFQSLSRTASSSLHSPLVAIMCISRQLQPSLEQTMPMSAIGESLTIRNLAQESSSSFRSSMSGRQSSRRNTFFPSAALLAGSRNMMSGQKSLSIMPAVAGVPDCPAPARSCPADLPPDGSFPS